MADDASAVSKQSVVIIHGAAKYAVDLNSIPKSNDELTVGDLATEVERLTQVPLTGQKLIHKGKSLTDHSKNLSSVGIKNGSKVMLIGKKFDVEEDEHMKAMRALERDIDQSEKKLHAIVSEVDGIKKGFLEKDLQQEAVPKLEKRSASCSEELTRFLEKLDALPLAESYQEIKGMRKKLVSRIQSLLALADSTKEQLKSSTPS